MKITNRSFKTTNKKTLKREIKLGNANREVLSWFIGKIGQNEIVPPINNIELQTTNSSEARFYRMLFTVIYKASYYMTADHKFYFRNLNTTTRKILKKTILTFKYDKKEDKFVLPEIPVFIPPLQVWNRAVEAPGMMFVNFIESDGDTEVTHRYIVDDNFECRANVAYDAIEMCIFTHEEAMRYFFLGLSDELINKIIHYSEKYASAVYSVDSIKNLWDYPGMHTLHEATD